MHQIKKSKSYLLLLGKKLSSEILHSAGEINIKIFKNPDLLTLKFFHTIHALHRRIDQICLQLLRRIDHLQIHIF